MSTLWWHNVDMNVAHAEPKRPLGVRATEEQHRLIADAAKLEHRSINSFVLRAAIAAAETVRDSAPRRRRTQAEIEAIVHEAQEKMKLANPQGRSLVDELIAERRKEAARE